VTSTSVAAATDGDAASPADLGKALGTDYFLLREDLTSSELDYLTRTRAFVEDEVLPVINDYWERAEFPLELCRRLGELGLVGDGLEGYGCPEMSPMAAGLVNMELSRGDGSVGTFLGVQAGLAMRSIHLLGSEEQKERWLPQMARVEKGGRRVRDRRREAMDRERDGRGRGRGLGPRSGGRPGEGLPGRAANAGI
jgi:glutaryl-CoA dehydrogenase